jgi:anaerobic ribonucleoside-triphosphate reductase
MIFRKSHIASWIYLYAAIFKISERTLWTHCIFITYTKCIHVCMRRYFKMLHLLNRNYEVLLLRCESHPHWINS